MPHLIMDHGMSGCFGTSLAPTTEGARFETPDTPETIGPDLSASVLSQSFTKAGR